MSQKTGISWTDCTWNPLSGCTRISEGCRHCYAESLAATRLKESRRYKGLAVMRSDGPHWTNTINLHHEMLDQPKHWKKGRRIFVNSMSDIFHIAVPPGFVKRIFNTMWECPQHDFQILTKRTERMYRWVSRKASALEFNWGDRINHHPMNHGGLLSIFNNEMRNGCGWLACRHGDREWNCQHPGNRNEMCHATMCPIGSSIDTPVEMQVAGIDPSDYNFTDGVAEEPDFIKLVKRPRNAFVQNAWLGTSCEDQETFDERISWMRCIRQALPHATLFLSLEPLLDKIDISAAIEQVHFSPLAGSTMPDRKRIIDWVIVGGESGPKARRFVVPWAMSIREQCLKSGTAFFMKQLGSEPRFGLEGSAYRLKSRNGSDPSEWPEELRVQEFPANVISTLKGKP